MPSPTSTFRFGFFLAVTLLAAHAIAQSSPRPVFIGTDPVAIGKVPVPVPNISSIGVDADGNQYYADSVAGRVIEVTPSGINTTITTGLTQPLIAVDFLGDVFVADTGTGRVLKVTVWPTRTTTVLATVSKQHAIALDRGNNLFLLSGEQLVEIPNNGTPKVMATIPGASFLGFGPGSPGTAHLYILSVQSGAYSAQLYSYSTTGVSAGTLSAPLHNFLPGVAGAVVEGFFVDPQGDTIAADNVSGYGKVVIGAANGYKHALVTTSIPTVPIAQDGLGNLYYVNGASLIKIQLGTVNFGPLNRPSHAQPSTTEMTLNFGAIPGVTYILSQNPEGEAFTEGDLCCGPLINQAKLYIYYSPAIVGYNNSVLNLTDQNNVTTLSIPLAGSGATPVEAYFLPAPDLKTHPFFQSVAAATETVYSRCQCGTFTLDRKAGSVIHDGNEIVSGLQNVRGADVDANGNLYLTQAGVAGVLRVDADGSLSNLGADIGDPSGSAMDDLGNLYVINGDDIIRIAPDESEAVFASPVTNGGYTSLLSIAVDLFNNVYAGYGTRPNSPLGAIVKFSPAGAHQFIKTDTKQPTGLAVYPCGPIYFADAERGSVAVVPISGQQKAIAYGLTDPTSLRCSPDGGVSGQDPGVAGGQFAVSPISFNFSYNFGVVAVGNSRSITLAAVTVGSDASGVAAGGTTIWPAGGPNFLPNKTITAGGLGSVTDVTLAFMPTAVGSYGPYAIQILDQGDEDSFSGYETIFLSGTGVNPP